MCPIQGDTSQPKPFLSGRAPTIEWKDTVKRNLNQRLLFAGAFQKLKVLEEEQRNPRGSLRSLQRPVKRTEKVNISRAPSPANRPRKTIFSANPRQRPFLLFSEACARTSGYRGFARRSPAGQQQKQSEYYRLHSRYRKPNPKRKPDSDGTCSRNSSREQIPQPHSCGIPRAGRFRQHRNKSPMPPLGKISPDDCRASSGASSKVMPISACRIIAASSGESDAKATVLPAFFKVRSTVSFWSGFQQANTAADKIRRCSSSSDSDCICAR